MHPENELHKAPLFQNLELMANQIVEGFISGIHKSPFHGFSAEFAEHKVYNNGGRGIHVETSYRLVIRSNEIYGNGLDGIICWAVLTTSPAT